MANLANPFDDDEPEPLEADLPYGDIEADYWRAEYERLHAFTLQALQTWHAIDSRDLVNKLVVACAADKLRGLK